MLIDTQQYHEYYPRDDGWEFKYIHFWGGMSREYLSYAESKTGPVFQLGEDDVEKMEELIDSVIDKTGDEAVTDYARISGDIYSMIILLLSCAEIKDGAAEPGGGSGVTEAALFIRRNYARPVSVTDIAVHVNLSRTYLTEQFKRIYGMPPHEYLTAYRLSAAKNLLINTSMTVTEIAEKTGFRDVYSFSRVFSRMNGISPAKYRMGNEA